MFNAYVVMMPIIEAEESLINIIEIAIGTGSLTPEETKKRYKQFQVQANERKRERVIPENIQNALLASMGMAVVDMRKKKKKRKKIKELKD